MAYFNTTHLVGSDLATQLENAITQEDKILAYFLNHKSKRFGPSDLWHLMVVDRAPLTSIRRAINSLTKQGWLVKTSHQKMGLYGKPECTWILASQERLG